MLEVPGAAALLAMWESGEREHAVDRALTILAAFSGQPRAALAALGVHRRDALLVRSRILAFGPRLEAVAPCGGCGCDVEVELQLLPPAEMAESGTLTLGERSIVYRAPNSYDLAAVAACDDVAEAEHFLRSRCITTTAALDDDALRAVSAALETLCEPATIELAATCPQCALPFAPLVDIAAILWRELAAYARRLLDDVDALATRYGWSEADILALPDVRRRRYVESFA